MCSGPMSQVPTHEQGHPVHQSYYKRAVGLPGLLEQQLLWFACFQVVDACLAKKLHGCKEVPQVMLRSTSEHHLCDDPTADISIMWLATAA